MSWNWRCILLLFFFSVLCWRTFSCPLGESRQVLKERRNLIKWYHIKSPVITRIFHCQSVTVVPFKPQVFWSSLVTHFWTCNIEKKCNFWKGQASNMQGLGVSVVDKEKSSSFLDENMPNIKLWSHVVLCNINRVLPFESILCLSKLKMEKGDHNYTAVLKTHLFFAHRV